MKFVAGYIFLLTCIPLWAQKPAGASATGNCNIVISGSNNTVTPATLKGTCTNGITKEQADKFVQMLNAVLTKKDAALINAKLDELLKTASQPTFLQQCKDSACAQGPGAQATLNQFGPPEPQITFTIDQADPERFRVRIRAVAETEWPNAALVVKCDRPCSGRDPERDGPTNYVATNEWVDPNNPNWAVLKIVLPAVLAKGTNLTWWVYSNDGKPINIVQIQKADVVSAGEAK